MRRLKTRRRHEERDRRRRHGLKIQAAKIVVRSGIPLVIASGKKKQVLAKILGGEDEGTLFVPQPTKLQGRQAVDCVFPSPQRGVDRG